MWNYHYLWYFMYEIFHLYVSVVMYNNLESVMWYLLTMLEDIFVSAHDRRSTEEMIISM